MRLFSCSFPSGTTWFAGLTAAAVLLAGCGGGMVRTAVAPYEAEKASTDYNFYDLPDIDEVPAGRRDKLIDLEIERLASPLWESARDNLLKMGVGVIPRLIANLNRAGPTHAGRYAHPGRGVWDKTDEWTHGQVVAAVLGRFVGSCTNYAGGALPSGGKSAWQSWWVANKRNIRAYAEARTVPEYVVAQHENQRKLIERRFPSVKHAPLKERRAFDIDKEKARVDADRREREDRLDARKSRERETRRRAIDRGDARRAEEEAKREAEAVPALDEFAVEAPVPEPANEGADEGVGPGGVDDALVE